MKNTKLFIVDDHYMVIEGIRSLLQHEAGLEWTGHASNAASCLAYLRQQQPDVILMDISLPDKNGIDLCKEVKEKYPSVFILGLSTFSQESFISKMMDNGASGYVLKNATKEELLEAIETVMKGRLFLSMDAAQSLRSAADKPGMPVITRREKEVLELIAAGCTNAEIAERLFVSVSTIDTHRKNLLEKFNVRNTASLVRLATQQQII
jgi:DNA-binding NarL/FixJ family response regulator